MCRKHTNKPKGLPANLISASMYPNVTSNSILFSKKNWTYKNVSIDTLTFFFFFKLSLCTFYFCVQIKSTFGRLEYRSYSTPVPFKLTPYYWSMAKFGATDFGHLLLSLFVALSCTEICIPFLKIFLKTLLQVYRTARNTCPTQLLSPQLIWPPEWKNGRSPALNLHYVFA